MAKSWSGNKVRKAGRDVAELYGDTCWLCGGAGANTVDHVVPRQHGGTDGIDNLRPAHLSCNQARGNRTRHAKRRRQSVAPTVQPRSSREW